MPARATAPAAEDGCVLRTGILLPVALVVAGIRTDRMFLLAAGLGALVGPMAFLLVAFASLRMG